MTVDEKTRDNLMGNPLPDAIRVSLIVTRILEELGVPYSLPRNDVQGGHIYPTQRRMVTRANASA